MYISVELGFLFLTQVVLSTFQPPKNFEPKSNKHLLLLAGTTKNGLCPHAEVIDLKNPHNECKMKSFSSTKVFGATGGLLNGDLPIVCGGIQGKSNCRSSTDDATMTSLTEERSFSASVILENDSELWITGGYNDDMASDTIEIVFYILDSLFSIAGPKLPIPLFGHCIVKITKDSFMVIGGSTYSTGSLNNDKTWIFNLAYGNWTRGPNLNVPRRSHACGVLHGAIIVTGGFEPYPPYALKSTEILNLDHPNHWIFGINLPQPLYSHSLIVSQESLIIAGGVADEIRNENLYELKCNDEECFWVKMVQKLKEGRCNMVALMVPDQFTSCVIN